MSTYTMSQGPTASNSHTPWRIVLAWVAVVAIPVALTVGFVLGYALGLDPSIADPLTGWDAAWRVVILWMVVAALPVAGMLLGWSARRHAEASALAAIIVNALVFAFVTLVTLVAGLFDAFG
jgi:hypothetical protein